ncbi:hypothetical protein D0469_18265 [Peribacillus saganii]|uniref:Uncharacterized protein n=1 Tax=Peribacillus saganii TaxID=2303992 RepID=A0A372LG19_9BACI|nr:hypothetical protein [Peribacillus saganii]RFU64505.1 hypothetical protein D0469_18265 [Peribacillus saganii]
MFTTIPPKGDYILFSDENEYIFKLKDWGLILANAKAPKHEFLYKRDNTTYNVKITGYEANGTHETAVVSFSNEALHCVHPAFLKEMQSSSFGRESVLDSPDRVTNDELPVAGEAPEVKIVNNKGGKKTSKDKPKKPILDLPAEKVSFEAVVKEFSTKYNHFNETEEEILIFEKVKILEENPLDVGEAWSGYSKTLKKLELAVGDALTFDAKIVDRKLNKDIRYKINNPSKLKKQS